MTFCTLVQYNLLIVWCILIADCVSGANVNIRDNSGLKPVDMLNYSCPESIRGRGPLLFRFVVVASWQWVVGHVWRSCECHFPFLLFQPCWQTDRLALEQVYIYHFSPFLPFSSIFSLSHTHYWTTLSLSLYSCCSAPFLRVPPLIQPTS